MSQVFDAVLEARFRQCPGHRKITRKQYSLRSDTQTKEIERRVDFRRCFLPGRRVEMSMVFEGSRLEVNVCPGCNLRCPESQEFQMSDIEWYNSLAPHLSKYSRVSSSGCGLRYRHTFCQVWTERPPFFSPGWSNIIMENSIHNQGPEYVEEDTPRQFRRVRVSCLRSDAERFLERSRKSRPNRPRVVTGPFRPEDLDETEFPTLQLPIIEPHLTGLRTIYQLG